RSYRKLKRAAPGSSISMITSPRIRGVVLAGLAVAALLLGQRVWYYSAGPSGEKDCSPAAPLAAPGRPVINDISCLNPTTVDSIVTVTSEDDVRQAIETARS